MYPSVNEVCKFTFIAKFTNLDGVYKVLSINSLNSLLLSKISIVDELYAKADPVLTSDDYTGDLPDIKDDKFYKLEHVTTKDIIYVPIFFMAEVPDPNVFEYMKLGFAVEIGIFAEETIIDWIKTQIGQQLQAVAGVEKTPDLFEIKSVWMTESEYATIKSDRDALISDVTNHYTDVQKLTAENTRLRTLVTQYETTLKALSSS